MKFSADDMEYLKGIRFSNGAVFSIADEGRTADRISLLCSLAEGKRVIHVGCADHLPLVERKRRGGLWLHGRLTEVSARCLGIDIDREATETVRDRYGVENVIWGDLAGDPIEQILECEWDLMVLGEVLEHLDEPVSFLRLLRERYAGHVRQVILTVPNATCWKNIRSALGGRECINTDHRFWFTPFTLAKIAVRSGWTPREFFYCMTVSGRNPLRRRLFDFFPALRDNLVMILES